MAYNQSKLDTYRQLIADGASFQSQTCPYCTGQRDSTPKHRHPSTKPDSPWLFWRNVVLEKYYDVQSTAARENMTNCTGPSPAAAAAVLPAESPRMFVVGPMVDQSELPFRMLCRQYGATLAYTPMMHAKSYAESALYRNHFFTTTSADAVKSAMERGAPTSNASLVPSSKSEAEEDDAADHLVDRPCFVQFCGHDADTVLKAAQLAVRGEHHEAYPIHVTRSGGVDELLYKCDAVDLNLGCPQGIARRGHYGSFLMEDWDLIHTIVHTLHVELEVPVTVKIRVFDEPVSPCQASDGPLSVSAAPDLAFDAQLTILYAKMLCDAGAQLLCIHGRTRAMKGQQTGLANLDLIRQVRVALGGRVPVIANGNVVVYDDVLQHLRHTGCDGHMCAEPLLWAPTLFSRPSPAILPGRRFGAPKAARLSALQTALTYLQWVRRCPVDVGFAKAHLFKICHHSFELHVSFRDALTQLRTGQLQQREASGEAARETNTKAAAVDIDDGDPGHLRNTTSASSSTDLLDAIKEHLIQLYRTELKCNVIGEQPKVAKAAKAEVKTKTVDVFDGDEDLGIDFSMLW